MVESRLIGVTDVKLTGVTELPGGTVPPVSQPESVAESLPDLVMNRNDTIPEPNSQSVSADPTAHNISLDPPTTEEE